MPIYTLKLIEYGLLTFSERQDFLSVWERLEMDENAFLSGPLMMEVVGRKR